MKNEHQNRMDENEDKSTIVKYYICKFIIVHVIERQNKIIEK